MAAYQADLKRLGALKNVVFVEVDGLGLDLYEARFDNGVLVFRVTIEPSGEITATWKLSKPDIRESVCDPSSR